MAKANKTNIYKWLCGRKDESCTLTKEDLLYMAERAVEAIELEDWYDGIPSIDDVDLDELFDASSGRLHAMYDNFCGFGDEDEDENDE